MSFSFSYIYEASDKFTPTAKKIQKAVKSLNADLKNTHNCMKKINQSNTTMKRGLEQTFKSANPHIVRTSSHVRKLSKELENSRRKVFDLQRAAANPMFFRASVTGNIPTMPRGAPAVPAGGAPSKAGMGAQAVAASNRMLVSGIAAYAGFAGFTKGARAFSEYERNLVSITKVINPSAKELEFLESRAASMGKEFAVSSNRILDAYKTVAAFTGDLPADELDKITTAAVTLSKAGEISVEESARALSAALGQYKVGADQAENFMNIMAAASARGSSEIADTAAAMSIAGTTAANMNLSFAETNAALQALAKVNIIGKRAGTGFAGALMRLEKVTVNGKNIMKDGLLPVLDEMAKAQFTSAELTEIFGMEHKKSGLALLQFKDWIRDTIPEIQGTSEAVKAASVSSSTLTDKWNRLGSVFENKVIQVFKGSSPAMKEFVDRITEMVEGINEDDIRGMAALFTMLADSLYYFAKGAAMAADGWSQIASLLGESAAKVVMGIDDATTVFTPQDKQDAKAIGQAVNATQQAYNKLSAGQQAEYQSSSFMRGLENMWAFTFGGGIEGLKDLQQKRAEELRIKVEAADGTTATVSGGQGIVLDTGSNVAEGE